MPNPTPEDQDALRHPASGKGGKHPGPIDLDLEAGAAPFDPWGEGHPELPSRGQLHDQTPTGDPQALGGLRRLATAGAIGLLGAAGTALFGWLRTKGLAVALGPPGMGLYGQLWSFVLYAGQLASLGIGVGVTALVAAEHERGHREGLTIAGSLTFMLPAIVGVIALVICLVAAPLLAPLLLDSSDVVLLAIAVLSIPFVAVQAPLQHLIQGMEDVVGQTVAYLIYGVGFTAVAVAGAFVAGVEGAAIGLTLGNVLLAALYLIRSRSLLGRAGAVLRLRAAGVRGALRSQAGRTLLRVGAGSLGIAVAFGVADLGVRTVLLKDSGDSVAGYWYALLLISVQFVGVLAAALSWLTAPLMARLNERRDPEAIGRILDDSVRLVCLVVLPLLALICALRDPFVDALFTSEFSPVSEQLPAQLAGDAMRSIGWTLGVALIPLGYLTAWVLIGVGSSLVFGVLGGVLAAQVGLDGAVTAWVVMWGVSLVATAAVVMRGGHWRPTPASAFGIVAGAAALAAATVAPGIPGVVLTGVAFGVALAVTTQATERQAAIRLLRANLRRHE